MSDRTKALLFVIWLAIVVGVPTVGWFVIGPSVNHSNDYGDTGY